ncbi:MAG: S-layer homology domain-containing protein [Clostridia bacterium]|nr:S-layer homology domain-containing protein [Clostridia bacterium]
MKKVTSFLLILILLFQCIPAFSAEVTFTDLNGHWARNYVLPLARDGIISGKGEGIFDPEANITRAEFVTLVAKLCNLYPDEASPYADVLEGAWFAPTVSAAKAYGALDENLVADGNFYPDAPITREEMTSVIVRLAEEIRGALLNQKDGFTDASSFAPWAAEYIAKAAGEGIVNGNPDGSFNAKGNATRAEAAVMIKRFRDLLNKAPRKLEAGEYHPVYDAPIFEVDLQQMIDEAYARGEKTLTLEKGAYRLKPQSTSGHLHFENMQDFTLDGNGSTFLFQSIGSVGVAFKNCKNVRLENCNGDYEKLAFFQARIIAIDPDEYTLDFVIPNGYRDYFEDRSGFPDQIYIEFHDGVTGDYLHFVPSSTMAFSKLGHLGNRTYRLHAASLAVNEHLKVGDYIVGGERLTTGTAVQLVDSERCTLKNYAIWSGKVGLGMSGGYGDHQIDHVRLEPGPRPLGATADRYFSTVADAANMYGMKIGPKIRHSVFSHCGDDGFNLFGRYARVAEIKGNELVLAVTPNYFFVTEGDTLHFYTDRFGDIADATVKGVEQLPSYSPKTDLTDTFEVVSFKPETFCRVTLDETPKGVSVGSYVSDADANNRGFEVTDTYYGNIRSRGMVVQSSEGLIENCTFYNLGSQGVWLSADTQWMGADMVRNVTVRNNTFIACGLREREQFASLMVSSYYDGRNKNITVEGNTFRLCGHSAMSFSATDGLIVKNNTVESRHPEHSRPMPVMQVEDVTDAIFEKNQFPADWQEVEQ